MGKRLKAPERINPRQIVIEDLDLRDSILDGLHQAHRVHGHAIYLEATALVCALYRRIAFLEDEIADECRQSAEELPGMIQAYYERVH